MSRDSNVNKGPQEKLVPTAGYLSSATEMIILVPFRLSSLNGTKKFNSGPQITTLEVSIYTMLEIAIEREL